MDNLPLTQDCQDRMNTQPLPESPIAFLGVNGVEYPLINGINKIGRKKDTCNVCLDLDSISREHAVVVIRALNKITIMDINSRNKTMLQNITLRPYISYPLSSGDILHFGDVMAVFKLFEPDDDIPMTQDMTMPDTPVATRNNCKNFTSVPETPDDGDKDDSCNTSTEISHCSIQEEFLEPGKPAPRNKPKAKQNDNALKKPVTLNFNSDSLKDTISVNNQSIHELETQLPCQGIDILNAETQLPSLTIKSNTVDQETDICDAETQLPPGVICNDSRNCEAKIHNADTELPLIAEFVSPKKELDKEQNQDDSNSVQNKATNEEESKVSIECVDDFIESFESQSLLTNQEIQGAIKDALICPEIKIVSNTNVSSDKKIDIEGADDGDITDCEDDLFDENIKTNITNDKSTEHGKGYEDDIANLPTQILNVNLNNETSPTKLCTNTDNKNNSFNQCDDIADQSKSIIGDSVPSQRVNQPTQIFGDSVIHEKNEFIEPTHIICAKVPHEENNFIEDQPTQIICDSVPCEDNKSIENQPTQLIGENLIPENKSIEDQPNKSIENQPTQLIGENLIPENKSIEDQPNKSIENQPTQLIGENLIPENKSIEDIENQPTQLIGENLIPENKSIEDQPTQILEERKVNPVRVVQKALLKDRNILFNESLNSDEENYYLATQEIVKDLISPSRVVESTHVQPSINNINKNNNEKNLDTPEETSTISSPQVKTINMNNPTINSVNVLRSTDNTIAAEHNYYLCTQDIAKDLNSPLHVSNYSTSLSNVSNSSCVHNSIKNSNKKVHRKSNLEETQNETKTRVAINKENKRIKKIPNTRNVSDDLLSENIKEIEIESMQRENDFDIVHLSKINKANKSFQEFTINTVNNKSSETSILDENKSNEKSLIRSRGKREVNSTKDLETIPKRRSQPSVKRDMETSQNIHCTTDIKKVETRQTRGKKANTKENTNKTPKEKEKNSIGKNCIEEKGNKIMDSDDLEPTVRRSGRHRMANTKYEDHCINYIKSSTRRSRRINADLKKLEESVVYNTSKDYSSALRKRPVPEPNLGPSTKKTKNDTSLETKVSVNTRRKQIHYVLFTALSNDRIREKLENLGAVVVNDVESCTVVVTEQLRRTFKLMCSIGLGKPIVGHSWIQACCDARLLVDPWQHLLKDPDGEKKLNFNLEQSLNAKRYFLKSYNVSCTPRVQPAPDELRAIVECSGGVWREGGERWLCVFAEADRALLPALGARGAVLVPRDVFLASVMRQRIDSLPPQP